MNKQTNRQLPSTAWKPGQSGNAAGRPAGARQKIAEKLIADIAEVWEARGIEVLKRLAVEEPAKLATIAYGLVPKDIVLNVAQAAPGGLEPDEWATLRRVLDIIQATAPDGVAPSLVFETIEHALRAAAARRPDRRSPERLIADLANTPQYARVRASINK